LKALLLRAPRDIVLEEVPVPEITADEVLVEVKCCGICGSDVHTIPDCLIYPVGTYLGHEFSGVLAKVGNKVKVWKAGDRVVVSPSVPCGECYGCKHGRQSICNHAFETAIGCAAGLEYAGGYAKFVRVPNPEKRLYRLPDKITFEEGALVEPLSCSLHFVRMSTFKPREKTMVLGCGMMGLGVIAHLKNAGAGLIIATETNEKRREVAKKLGADYVFNPQKVSNLKEEVLKLTNGEGVEVVFDCSGVLQAFQSATSFLRRGGQLLLAGLIAKEVSIVPANFVINEWQLQGALAFYSDEFPMVIDFLEKGISPVKELITSKIKLGNIVKEGFDVLAKPGNNESKVIVEPDE